MPHAPKIAPQFHLQVAFVRVLRDQGATEGPLELHLSTRLHRPNTAPTSWRSVWQGTLAEGDVLPLLGIPGDQVNFELPSVTVDVEVRLREVDQPSNRGVEADTAIAHFQLGTTPVYVQRILTLDLPTGPRPPFHPLATATVEVSILSTMTFPTQD